MAQMYTESKDIRQLIKCIVGSDFLECEGFPQGLVANKDVLEIAIEEYVKSGRSAFQYLDGKDISYFFEKLSKTVSPETWEELTNSVLEDLTAPFIREVDERILNFERYVEDHALHVRAFLFVQMYGNRFDKIKNVDWEQVHGFWSRNLDDALERVIEEYWNEEDGDDCCYNEALLQYFKTCVAMF